MWLMFDYAKNEIQKPTVKPGWFNALIHHYGLPKEIIVEVANDLKRRKDHRKLFLRPGQKHPSMPLDEVRPYCNCAACVTARQSQNQKLNQEFRKKAAEILQIPEGQVTPFYMERMRIFHDMEKTMGIVVCPYSGKPIGKTLALLPSIEVDHILPFSRTLDDSLANKVLCFKEANQVKGEHTPFEAKEDFEAMGWHYSDIEQRVANWDEKKRFRFRKDAIKEFFHGEDDFQARALNDTRYLSRIAKEYLKLICPHDTSVIPGQMTAKLRSLFGLNSILSSNGEKNRNDHRHHAIDACVIGVTDRGMLQKFANANAAARKKGIMEKLVETKSMPYPFESYRAHVTRAIENINVSHRPDHGYQGALFDETIYNAQGHSRTAAKDRAVIPFFARRNQPSAIKRHMGKQTEERPYKGLLPNSNYCIEIAKENDNQWIGEVVSTFQAYSFIRQEEKKLHEEKSNIGLSHGLIHLKAIQYLRNPKLTLTGKPLIMRLSIGDYIRIDVDNEPVLLQVLKINSSGVITFIKPNETNIPARYAAQLKARNQLKAKGSRDSLTEDEIVALEDSFFQKAFSADSLKTAKARRVTISPIGVLHDPGFHE
jgi:CRISPR-associated endonuclease Csn1